MITRNELNDFLTNALPVWNELADDNYSLPTRDWIALEFSTCLKMLLDDLAFKWEPDRSDCDDFARLAAAYCCLLHSNTGADSGLAFGEFWFTRRDGQGHAINVFVTREIDGSLALNFFEPQTQQIIELTKEEIQSCDFCRF